MLINPDQEALIGRVFEVYLREHHHGDLLQLVADTSEETHHPVVVNAMTLFEANMEVGDYFNAYPSDVLAIFDKVLNITAMELSQNASSKHSGGQKPTEVKKRHTLHARITGLPVCPELTRDTIPRSRDVGHFLSVTGTVIRTSVAKVLEYERDYMCSKCRHVFMVQADFEQFYTFVQPVACPNPDHCNSNKFICLSGGSEPASCRDYQEIKIQEQVQRLSVGCIPRSMVVVLEEDLVDSCKSGDDVTVYGVMCQRWKPFYDGTCCSVELVLKANNVEVNNQQTAAGLVMKDVQKEFEDFWNSYQHDPTAGRNQILLSLCPQVFGMYLIKLAVAMVLAGGVQRIDCSGTKIRGECHMLLVGDPGTGKSQFLKYAAKIMPRSVLTAGIGLTSAGLTVAAVKDGGDWHLEAGALVLSDGGLCCIDEFNSIKEHDRISIHEAMEQQSISVAKAGMVCKLNTRTTILAATNPKGQYDPNEPLSVNVALASPLLSRFDLVVVLIDTRNTEWDRIISSFILDDRGLSAESSSLWSMEKMKAYFSMIRCLQPQVSEEANIILTRYYQLQRQSEARNSARTTIRMLESLSRLAEAHARLMYRETVTIEDAVMAVSVMECSMQGGALLGNVNALLTSFPADPGHQYQTQCQTLLEGLNLPLLLQKEIERLAMLKSNTSDSSPPTDDYDHQLRETNYIKETHYHDITSNCSGDGLDWFHSITPSALPDGMATPIITSTQRSHNKICNFSWPGVSTVTKQPNCETEKDILLDTDLTLNCDAVSDSFGTITSASEQEQNREGEKKENIKENGSITQEKIRQSPISQKYVKRPESLGSVFQKVSKNLRDRRLRDQELNHQQCDKEEGGNGEWVVSRDGASKNVTISESHTSSRLSFSKKCSLNNVAKDNLSFGKESRFEMKEKRDRTRTKNISAGLKEKRASEAETSKELHEKLSGFVFNPRKIRPSVQKQDFNSSSDVRAEFLTECTPCNRDFHTYTESRIRKQKPVNEDPDREKNEREKRQAFSKDGSSKNQGGCVSDVGDRMLEDSTCLTSKELNKSSFGNHKLAQGKTLDTSNTENLCQQQRTRANTGDETIEDSFTCIPSLKPGTFMSDPTLANSGHAKSTVASSTLAKLSRFSFIHPTEPATVAHTKLEKNPPTGVETSSLKRDCTECPRGNSKGQKTLNFPKNSPLGKKIQTVAVMGEVKDVVPLPDTELTPAQKYEQGAESSAETMSESKEKQIKPTYSASNGKGVEVLNDGPAVYQQNVTVKKRKCFELGPSPSSVGGSKSPFSGLALFGSVELSNDVLDTDWDQEVSKRAKICNHRQL